MTRNNENQENLFDEYAYDWWNKTGNYKLLHKLNPLRVKYILSKLDIKNKKIVDEERAFTFKKLYEHNWKESPKKNFLW